MRTINVAEAAKRLKMSTAGVNYLVKRGLLSDLKPRVKGKRHHAILNSKEVTELAKARNGSKRVYVTPVVNTTPAPVQKLGLFAQLEKIEQNINKLEQKIDTLIAIWS